MRALAPFAALGLAACTPAPASGPPAQGSTPIPAATATGEPTSHAADAATSAAEAPAPSVEAPVDPKAPSTARWERCAWRARYDELLEAKLFHAWLPRPPERSKAWCEQQHQKLEPWGRFFDEVRQSAAQDEARTWAEEAGRALVERRASIAELCRSFAQPLPPEEPPTGRFAVTPPPGYVRYSPAESKRMDALAAAPRGVYFGGMSICSSE